MLGYSGGHSTVTFTPPLCASMVNSAEKSPVCRKHSGPRMACIASSSSFARERLLPLSSDAVVVAMSWGYNRIHFVSCWDFLGRILDNLEPSQITGRSL